MYIYIKHHRPPNFACLLGRVQISHSHNDTATIPTQSSVLHLKAYLTSRSSIHGPWALSLWARAKISFWQTMQWIKGHTWPLSCSLGDQTHFQGQELLTGLFNPQGLVGNLREVYGNGLGDQNLAGQKFCSVEQDRWSLAHEPSQLWCQRFSMFVWVKISVGLNMKW